MDTEKRSLCGSAWRDRFKQRHKALPGHFYACDLDLALVSKTPPGVVAFVDYKHPRDHVTFAEVLLYNALSQVGRVYIIRGPLEGPFEVFRYLGGDPGPNPPAVRLVKVCTCANWREFAAWEADLRKRYRYRDREG
jgi:hypothetical protein